MNLKSITFGFENCEVLTIDGKYVCQFLVDNITKYFARIACNSIDKVEVVNTFIIEIAAGANDPYHPFGLEESCGPNFKFERLLQYNDITSIDFTLQDERTEETYTYWLYWGGDSEYSNAAQYTYLSDLGNLYIVVSKDKKFEDYFDKEIINDKNSIDFDFDMCDVPH